MTPKEEKLLPCPLCGGIAELVERGNIHNKKRSAEISCASCGVKIIVAAIYNTLEWCVEAVSKKWNTRPSVSQPMREEKCPEGCKLVAVSTGEGWGLYVETQEGETIAVLDWDKVIGKKYSQSFSKRFA